MKLLLLLLIYIEFYLQTIETNFTTNGNIIFKTYSLHENSTNDTIDQLFDHFKLAFSKQYDSAIENELRKFNFLNAIEYIAKHNKLFVDGYVSHQLAVNKFIDLSNEEILKTNLQNINNKLNAEDLSENTVSTEPTVPQILFKTDSSLLLTDFDWRLLNKVSKAKDQLSCNCCYAFTVTATIESAIAIRDNLTLDLTDLSESQLDLSEQQIVDCSKGGKYRNNGCDYGYIDDSYQYVIDNGIVSEQLYPYIDENSACLDLLDTNRTFITKFIRKSRQSVEQIKQVIYENGPVISMINNDGFDFLFYDQGIIKTDNKTRKVDNYFNHAVVIVGWGETNGTKYWIIKNSWSDEWGESGFARIEFGVRGVDEYIYYPVLLNTNQSEFDLYSNVLIFVLIVLAILMFLAITIIFVFCCNDRGKLIFFQKFNLKKLFTKRKEKLLEPDLLRETRKAEFISNTNRV